MDPCVCIEKIQLPNRRGGAFDQAELKCLLPFRNTSAGLKYQRFVPHQPDAQALMLRLSRMSPCTMARSASEGISYAFVASLAGASG
jgi:hypothetical protein